MALDRLGDIPEWALEEVDDDENEDPEKQGDVEKGPTESKQERLMENFFREVDTLKADIDFVKKVTAQIGQINEEALLAATTEEEQALSSRLQPLVTETNKRAKRTKNLLTLLKDENTKLEEAGDLKQPQMRVRKNLVTTLTRKFIDEMKAYQLAQQKYKTDVKTKAKRQIQIVKPNVTDEEVDTIMRSEGGRDEFYKATVQRGQINQQVRDTYDKVSGKYQDVVKIEQSIAELHQMFLDMALLTEQQGELLDQIEFQVKTAGDYIEEGNVETHTAIEHQKSIRKKQCWLIVIVTVCIAVVVFGFILR